MAYKDPEKRRETRKKYNSRPDVHAKNMEYQRKWREANPEKRKAQSERVYQSNRDKLLSGKAADRKANPEKYRAADRASRERIGQEVLRQRRRNWYARNKDYAKKWVKANPDKVAATAKRYKQKHPEHCLEWARRNPDKAKAKTYRYRARKLNALPNWLTKEQNLYITMIYKEASRLTELTGISHHVDHIVPLQGEDVCGLHVPWNLQVLPYYENLSKGNKCLSI